MRTISAQAARFLLLGLSAIASTGCGSSSAEPAQDALAIENPSGSCKATGDGSRAGYHFAAGTQWLPDCQNPLRREYWRVFAQAPDSAYVVPRPDGAFELALACNDPGHELDALLVKYSLCQAASSSEQVQRVNDVLPADALTITRYMHRQLRFTATEDIAPFPLPSDIVDACALHPERASVELQSICDRERARLRSGHDIGYDYRGPGAVELVALLNELYGIP